MPNLFSRIAGASPRVSAARKKLFAIVSPPVSTAGPAMRVPSLSPALPLPPCRRFFLAVRLMHLTSSRPLTPNLPSTPILGLPPSLLLLPAPLASRALLLGAKVEFLDVLGMHQAVAGVVHHDASDFQHIAVMGRLQRHPCVLLDQQDRHALLLVDTADDRENLLHQDRRQPERRLVEQQQRRPVHQRAA